jgi:hypothetical protein
MAGKRDQKRAVVKAVMNIRVLKKYGSVLVLLSDYHLLKNDCAPWTK